jgi:hypothetical protein
MNQTVLRDAGMGDVAVEGIGGGPSAEPVDHQPAARIGQRLEHPVQGGVVPLEHLVKHVLEFARKPRQ